MLSEYRHALNDGLGAVEGEAFEVTMPGRRAFYRIKAERLETPDFTIPPLEPTPLFREPTDDEQADLDAALERVP